MKKKYVILITLFACVSLLGARCGKADDGVDLTSKATKTLTQENVGPAMEKAAQELGWPPTAYMHNFFTPHPNPDPEYADKRGETNIWIISSGDELLFNEMITIERWGNKAFWVDTLDGFADAPDKTDSEIGSAWWCTEGDLRFFPQDHYRISIEGKDCDEATHFLKTFWKHVEE